MRLRSVAGLVVAALIAGACTAARPGDGTARPQVLEPPAGAGWRPLAASPLSARAGSASAWSGRELLIWGGADCGDGGCDRGPAVPLGDGAAYDPARDSWRVMPPSMLRARSDAGAVWTGQELLVWGGIGTSRRYFADGAGFNPATNAWRSLAPAPLAARADPAVAWTGREMLVWGGFAGSHFFDDGAAYDPQAGTWRPIAASPLSGRFGTARWTGSLWLMWGGAGETADGAGPLGDGAAYDPALDAWRPLPESPLSARSGPARIWTGDELLVVGGSAGQERFDDGAGFRPAVNRWRPVAPFPGVTRVSFASEWTGEEMLLWGGQAGDLLLGSGGAYDPVTNQWRRLPPGEPRSSAVSAWTGDELIVWGGFTRLPAVGSLAVSAGGARLVP